MINRQHVTAWATYHNRAFVMPKRCASVFRIINNEAVADHRDAIFCNIDGHRLIEGGTRK